LEGRNDEFRELADAFDAMLARLEATRRRTAEISLPTPPTNADPAGNHAALLDVARSDPNRDNGELVDRLHAVNTRRSTSTEALLLLSRATNGPSRQNASPVSHSGRSHRNAPALAEKRGLTIETSGAWPDIGSHALLLQLTTNLCRNAIVHNLPEHGKRVGPTNVHPESWCSPSRTPARKLAPQ